MLIMVIQVNPTIDEVLYYLVLKDQGEAIDNVQLTIDDALRPRSRRFLFFKLYEMNG